MTVQCLSAAPSCTHISRALASSLIKLWISHLKSFLFAWPCVFLPDYAVMRIFLATLLRVLLTI